MDLISLKKEICRYTLNRDKNRLFYYDKKIEEFNYIDKKRLNQFLENNSNEEDYEYNDEETLMLKYTFGLSDIISLPVMLDKTVKPFIEEFIALKNNSFLNELQFKKNYIASFYNTLKIINLEDDWIEFILSKCDKEIETFIDENNIYEIEAKKEDYVEALRLAIKIHDLAPWNDFISADIIEYNNDTYYSVLGNKGSNYGLAIYKEEEINGLKTILNNEFNNINELLLMGLQNNYTVYFDKFDEESNKYLFLKELGIEKEVDNFIPYIVCYEEGIIKTNLLRLSETKNLINKLELFISFYNNFFKTRHLYKKEDDLYNLSFNQKGKITNQINFLYSVERECILKDTKHYPKITNFNFNDDVYEVDLRGINIMNHDEEYRYCSICFLLTIIDRETGIVIAPFIIDGSNKTVILDIHRHLCEFIKKNGFAKKVYVNNLFLKQLFEDFFHYSVSVRKAKLKFTDELFKKIKNISLDDIIN